MWLHTYGERRSYIEGGVNLPKEKKKKKHTHTHIHTQKRKKKEERGGFSYLEHRGFLEVKDIRKEDCGREERDSLILHGEQEKLVIHWF